MKVMMRHIPRGRRCSIAIILALISLLQGISSVSAEIFRKTISDSSCRYDIGQFTFTPQTTYTQVASVEATIVKQGICRVPHAYDASFGPLQHGDLTEAFRQQAAENDAAELADCVSSTGVYLLVAPVDSFDPSAYCSLYVNDVGSVVDKYNVVGTFTMVVLAATFCSTRSLS